MASRSPEALVDAVFEAFPAPTLLVDAEVRVEQANESARQLLGSLTSLNRRGGEILHCVHADEAPGGCGQAKACEECVVRGSVAEALSAGRVRRRRAFMQLRTESAVAEVHLLISAAPLRFDGRELCILTFEDISELVHLRSVVSLCAHCNRVRAGQGDWQKVEAFLKDRIDLDCSHSICEECLERYFPERSPG